jgi:hypothetical protein
MLVKGHAILISIKAHFKGGAMRFLRPHHERLRCSNVLQEEVPVYTENSVAQGVSWHLISRFYSQIRHRRTCLRLY